MIDQIIGDIIVERADQATKWNRPHPWGWGDCSSNQVNPTTKATVLLEEAGEVARAILDQDLKGLRRELVQLAAVCVAIIQWVDKEGTF